MSTFCDIKPAFGASKELHVERRYDVESFAMDAEPIHDAHPPEHMQEIIAAAAEIDHNILREEERFEQVAELLQTVSFCEVSTIRCVPACVLPTLNHAAFLSKRHVLDIDELRIYCSFVAKQAPSSADQAPSLSKRESQDINKKNEAEK